MCRATVLADLTAHLLEVNAVAGLRGDAAKSAFMHEVYNRAYTVHVLVSCMDRWRIRGPLCIEDGIVEVPRIVESVALLLVEE
jgi:hypothetical protein